MNEEMKKSAEKAMSLLLFQDRTEKELEHRLLQNGFSEDAVAGTMDYVKEYGYIDDARYAANFIMLKGESKSKKEIEYKLKQKGVDSDIIYEAFRELTGDTKALKNAIRLRLRGGGKEISDERKKQKLIAYLVRRGFDIHDIVSEIKDVK